jgi:hypothetical protein
MEEGLGWLAARACNGVGLKAIFEPRAVFGAALGAVLGKGGSVFVDVAELVTKERRSGRTRHSKVFDFF